MSMELVIWQDQGSTLTTKTAGIKCILLLSCLLLLSSHIDRDILFDYTMIWQCVRARVQGNTVRRRT